MLIAYHNKTALRKDVLSIMAEHRKADRLVKGHYWQNGKGCAVGCLLKSGNHIEYEEKFGIPAELAYLEDNIFEKLDNGESQKWPERFLSAIKIGVDLSLIGWKFKLFVQVENLKLAKKEKMPENVIAAINQVLPVLKHAAAGKPQDAAWNAARNAAESAARNAAENAAESAARNAAESAAWSAAWNAARSAAWSAARSAARNAARNAAESAARSAARNAARNAAESAAWSAAESAAYKKFAAKLITLIKAAPKVKQ